STWYSCQACRCCGSPSCHFVVLLFLIFSVTCTPAIYTLSLHDALPIFGDLAGQRQRFCTYDTEMNRQRRRRRMPDRDVDEHEVIDRKSTRLNSSHVAISYAVFCLKKKTPLKRDHVERGHIQMAVVRNLS